MNEVIKDEVCLPVSIKANRWKYESHCHPSWDTLFRWDSRLAAWSELAGDGTAIWGDCSHLRLKDSTAALFGPSSPAPPHCRSPFVAPHCSLHHLPLTKFAFNSNFNPIIVKFSFFLLCFIVISTLFVWHPLSKLEWFACWYCGSLYLYAICRLNANLSRLII